MERLRIREWNLIRDALTAQADGAAAGAGELPDGWENLPMEG